MYVHINLYLSFPRDCSKILKSFISCLNVVEIKSIRGCTASEALCPFLLKINHMYSSLNYLLTKKSVISIVYTD